MPLLEYRSCRRAGVVWSAVEWSGVQSIRCQDNLASCRRVALVSYEVVQCIAYVSSSLRMVSVTMKTENQNAQRRHTNAHTLYTNDRTDGLHATSSATLTYHGPQAVSFAVVPEVVRGTATGTS